MSDPSKPLTSAEIADLVAKAKAATPGPWIRFDSGGLGHPGWIMYPEDVRAKFPDAGNGYGALCWASEDGVGDVEFRRKEIDENFIAAANPETVLRLLDMVEKFRGALVRIASFDDAGAIAHLRATGSYGAFDEPGSVNIAREALSTTAPQAADATADRKGGE